MNLKRAKFFLIIHFLLFFISGVTVKADVTSDTNTLFNWAESTFADLFLPAAQTEELDIWLYRYYSGSNMYLGVETTTQDVYLLNGTSGELINVGPLSQLLLLMENDTGSGGSNGSSSVSGDGGDNSSSASDDNSDGSSSTNGNPDDSSSVTDDTNNSSSNDACVTLPLPIVNRAASYISTNMSSDGSIELKYQLTYTEASSTKLTSSSVTTVDTGSVFFSSEIITEEQYQFIDGQKMLEKITITNISNNNGEVSTKTSQITYSPSKNAGASSLFCQDSSWSTPSVSENIISAGESENRVSLSSNTTIKKVNENINVTGGSFNTVYLVEIFSDGTSIETWRSIDTNILVKEVSYAADGSIIENTVLESLGDQ